MTEVEIEMENLQQMELDQEDEETQMIKTTPLTENTLFANTWYGLSYIAGAFYSLYCFYQVCQVSMASLPLTKQYSFFGPYQDQMDWEWTIFSPLIVQCLPHYLIHLILSQVLKKFVPQVLPVFYISYSTAMLLYILGPHGTLICYAVVTVMFAVLVTRKKYLIWLMWCLILILLNTRQFTEMLGIWLEDVTDGEYKTSVMVAWIILRSLSFSLETCDQDPHNECDVYTQLLTCLSYALYFPLVLTGPYMPYTDYQKGLAKNYEEWTLRKVCFFFLNLLHFFVIMIVSDISLHYFYAHSMFEFPYLLSRLDSWAMAGFVYYLLLFFFFKYIVFYGLSGTFARYDGFAAPRYPRCVLAVYRASDVWRYFDLGLYKFMIRHIYLPFVGPERSMVRQLQGSVVVFTFIYVWHGVSNSVFWWAVINFLGVTIEKILDRSFKSHFYARLECKYLPGRMNRVFQAFLYSFLVLMTVLSMIIFLSSLENSKAVMHRIFVSGFPNVTITTMFFFYYITQCGMSLEQFRQKQQLKAI